MRWLKATMAAIALGVTAAHAEDILAPVSVVASTPIGGTSIAVRDYPGNVQTLDLEHSRWSTHSISELLDRSIGSINLSDTQGNGYLADLNYRGFVGSPVLGTPQGLSVFLDGMRMNESFGDGIGWDLIPLIAIRQVSVIPGSNPIYGLNTLGGALSLRTRSGLDFAGSNAKLTLGAFERRSISVETGGHDQQFDYYLAANLDDDAGWAAYNPSSVRQLFGKLGWRQRDTELSLSILYADNRMHGNQTVPLSLLSNAAQGYSHPDYSNARNLSLQLSGHHSLESEQGLGFSLGYRHIVRDIFNSNITTPVDAAVNDATCASSPGPGSNCPASNLIAHSDSKTYAAQLQWTNEAPVLGLRQALTVGLASEYGRTEFSNSGQNAYVDPDHQTIGVDGFINQASIRSNTRRLAGFATDTLKLSDPLALTLSARWDQAAISLDGTACSDAGSLCNDSAAISTTAGSNTLASVQGTHHYQRVNPSAGLAYQIAPGLTGFGNYSEGFRTPSALELACADPKSPCSGIPNAFSADPDLQAVVAHTIEAGLRGTTGRALRWHAAAFQSNLSNDILFNQTNAVQGYFANVGKTRRTGLELGLDGQSDRFEYGVAGSWVVATFRTPFVIANEANSQCIAQNGAGNGCANVSAQPGDRIPGIPALTLKTHVGYAIDHSTRVSVSLQAQGPQYARGDENNQDTHGAVPGFATVRLDATRQLNRTIELRAAVGNLFDRRYANFGQLGANNLDGGMAEQFRSVAPPRNFSLSLLAHW